MDNVPVSVMEREFHFESGVKAEMIMWGVTTPDICWVITMGKKRRSGPWTHAEDGPIQVEYIVGPRDYFIMHVTRC